MFNLGFSEILIIGALALLLIGPKQLPEMARVLGRMMNEFKKATSDLQGGLLEMKNELQRPMQEGFEAMSKIQEDLRERVTDAATDAMNLDDKTAKINVEKITTTDAPTTTDSKDESKG